LTGTVSDILTSFHLLMDCPLASKQTQSEKDRPTYLLPKVFPVLKTSLPMIQTKSFLAHNHCLVEYLPVNFHLPNHFLIIRSALAKFLVAVVVADSPSHSNVSRAILAD